MIEKQQKESQKQHEKNEKMLQLIFEKISNSNMEIKK